MSGSSATGSGNRAGAAARRTERNARIWQMSIDAYTEHQIAAEVGLSQPQVHAILDAAMKERTEAGAAARRAVAAEKLDQAERAVLAVLRARHVTVNAGKVVRVVDESGKEVDLLDDAPVLAAVDRWVKIEARRAAMFGYDAPTKVHTDGTVRYEVVGVDADALS